MEMQVLKVHLRFCPLESLSDILSISWSQPPERFLGSKMGQKFRSGCPWGCPSQPSLFDTTFWFSVSKTTATSRMSPPNLEGAMASTDFSNKPGILVLHCSGRVGVQSGEEERLWSQDAAEGSASTVRRRTPSCKVTNRPLIL